MLLLANTDSLQQGLLLLMTTLVSSHFSCTWQMKKVNIVYRLHKLVFVRGNNNLECFNPVTHKYGLLQPVLVRYRLTKTMLSWLSLTSSENKTGGVHVPCLFQGWHTSVFFSTTCSYIFVCFLIHHDKACISTRMASWQVKFKYCNMSPTQMCFAVCCWRWAISDSFKRPN